MSEKRKVVVLVVLLAVAAVVWFFVWNKQSGDSQQVFALDAKLLAVENPQIRWDELKRAQQTEYKTNGRNPFSMIKPPPPGELKGTPAAIVPAVQKTPYGPMPPPPPPPPQPAVLPPNLKFFGYGTVPTGSARRAFFTDGDDVYIVPEGDVLLGRFRILKVGNTNIEFQEISTGQRGSAPLEEPAAAAPNA